MREYFSVMKRKYSTGLSAGANVLCVNSSLYNAHAFTQTHRKTSSAATQSSFNAL